jgi:hypothetical protein
VLAILRAGTWPVTAPTTPAATAPAAPAATACVVGGHSDTLHDTQHTMQQPQLEPLRHLLDLAC